MSWTHWFPHDTFRPHQPETLCKIVEAFSHKRFVILQSPCGCHAKGTRILMYDGTLKNVEDILVGDILTGPDGSPRNVIALHRGKEQMARIIPTKGEAFEVNMSHILSLQRYGMGTAPQKRRSDWKGDNPVTNISVKDYLAKSWNFRWTHKLYRAKITHWVKKEVPIPPYILGIWLGDGTSNKPEITKKDEEVLQAWRNYGMSLGLKITETLNSAQCPQLYLSRGDSKAPNPVTSALKSLNVWNNKHIPLIYKTGSIQQRLELLAGLLDTDGHLSTGSYDFISKSQELADQTAFVARSVGLAAYVTPCTKYAKKRDGTCSEPKTYYRVSISGDVSIVPCKVPRKIAAPRKQVKNVLRTAFEVKILPEADYFGFEVDGDHLYVMGDFTVTHNSGKSSMALALARHYLTAYLATITKQLQDQYWKDYSAYLAMLKGKSNYPCTRRFEQIIDGRISCAEAPCGVNLPLDKYKAISNQCEKDGSCPYLKAKNAALYDETSPIALLNFSNLLAFSDLFDPLGNPLLPKRDLLVLDEGHRLENELYNFAEIDLTLQSFHKISNLIPSKLQKALSKRYRDINEAAETCSALCAEVFPSIEAELADSGKPPRELIPLIDAKRKLEKIEVFVKQHGAGLRWIPNPHELGTKLSPLRVDHLRDLAFRSADKILLMSGTILDPETFAKNLGIKPGEYEYIEVPSTFPPENRPIMVYPVGKLSKDHLEATFPRVVNAVKLITTHHNTEKGIIQTYNYKISEMLYEHFRHDPRFLFQLRNSNKADLLAHHFSSSEPTVLVGPGFMEGLDFKDDYCRHQTLIKMPCPDLGNPVISERAKEERKWYNLQVAFALLQILGRPIRSATDKAVQYIVDSYFSMFYDQNRHLFPEDVQKTIIFSNK